MTQLRPSRSFGAIVSMTASSIIALTLASPLPAVQEWNNLGTGSSAGNWFDASNWTPVGVPNSSLAASINNGGEAAAMTGGGPLSALQIDIGKNNGTGALTTNSVGIAVQGSIDIGVVDATFANGSMTTSAMGQAILAHATDLNVGLSGVGDVNAGQTSAANGAVATGTGTVTIRQLGQVVLAGDLDLGQASGNGQATGDGTATVQAITGLVVIGGDLDVGQTSATLGGVNAGTGRLTASQIGSLEIANDFDVGQASGDGQATAHGTAQVADVTNLIIGDSLDIAKIRAIGTAIHGGIGSVTVSNATLSVGLGAANPGSIEIARVLVSESARGTATGTLILDHVGAQVANDVIVGELALGSSHPSSTASGTLRLVNSHLVTRDLSIASRMDNTQGSLEGRLELARSLVAVGSVMGLGQGSTIAIDIDGVARGTGPGDPGAYGAIDAEQAVLAGALEIHDGPSYTGPALRGASDQFQLVVSGLGISGSFATATYDGTALGPSPAYVGRTSNGTDGLFASIFQTATQVVLETYLALPGDANGDGAVDGSDFGIWNSHKFTTGNDWGRGDFNGDGSVDGTDFGIWNANKFTSAMGRVVPEPSLIIPLLTILVPCVRSRRNRSASRPSFAKGG